jgi:hypothetical protein
VDKSICRESQQSFNFWTAHIVEAEDECITNHLDLIDAIQHSTYFNVVIEFKGVDSYDSFLIVLHSIPFIGVLIIAYVELAIVSPEFPPALFFENKGGYVGKK